MENIDMSSVQLITDSYQNYHRSVYLYILYKIGKMKTRKIWLKMYFTFDGL